MNTKYKVPARASGQARDATERELRLIVDCIPGFVWYLQSDGELHYLNSKVSAFTGKSLEELREPHWRDVMHPDDIEPFVSAWTSALASVTPIEIEFRLRRVDGLYRWFRSTGAPEFDELGAVSGWCGVDIDVEDKRQMEMALHNAQTQLAHSARLAMAGELVASIADAINQPLAAVMANGYACQHWLAQAPPNVYRAKLAVDSIINDAVTVAEVAKRIHGVVARAAPTKAPFSLNDAILEVLRVHESALKKDQIVVSMKLHPELPLIDADVTMVQQVLVNLIRNAADAMRSQQEVPRNLGICSAYREGRVVAEVSDSGIGFSDDARLFDAFYTTKVGGLGLGLAISRSVVESYGGTLWAAHSEPVGSTFGFGFPATK